MHYYDNIIIIRDNRFYSRNNINRRNNEMRSKGNKIRIV